MQRSTVFLLLVFQTFLIHAAGAEGPPAAPGRERGEPIRVKVEGALLSYFPLEVPPEKRTPQGEIEVLRRAAGTLLVDRPVAFRRARLPAGEYELRIESEGRGHRLVIAAPPAGERGEDRGRDDAKRRSRRKSAPVPAAAADAPVLEKKSEREPRGAGENGAEDGGGKDASPAPGLAGGKRAETGNAAAEPKEESAANEEKPAPALRVPLTLATCEGPPEKLTFELKVSNRGTKLKLAVRAGNTEARASLRFADSPP